MRYNWKRKSLGKNTANHKNTPHLIEKTTVIILAYGISGINLIFAGLQPVKTTDIAVPKYLFLVGIVMLLMIPISMLDNRREMRSKLAAILGCSMHLVICTMLSLLFSFWWLAIYGIEVILCISAIIIVRKCMVGRVWRKAEGHKGTGLLSPPNEEE